MRTIAAAAADLAAGKTTSRNLVEDCLAAIEDKAGEGRRVFLKVYGEAARAAADTVDGLRKRGAAPSRFAGIPISLKDLFDVAGEPTPAGSAVLKDAAPATHDAICVARVKAAGLIPMGRTNMSEFAFTGLGINPHYGTPANPYDRAARRIPGGSSSGAAVSVADGMAFAGLGTDTGGSCRIPAALCGLVGYKPTAKRVPTAGALPLSTSLDSIGPLALSVACCAAIDAILAGEEPRDLTPFPLKGLRVAVPRSVVFDAIDEPVGRAFEAALQALSKAGANVTDIALSELKDLATINRKGGFAAPEAYAWHRALIETSGPGYDPQVLTRILRGKEQEAADYIDLIAERAVFIRRVEAVTAPFDVLAMPTTPLIAPPIKALEDDTEMYRTVNLLMLRNPAIVNFLDRCAISVPCHKAGDAPVGLMLVGQHGGDHKLFAMAAAVEKAVSPSL